MSMDAVIHRHLNTRLDIQEKAAEDVKVLVGGINLNALIDSPEKELARVAKMVMDMAQVVAQDAADEGQRFAAEVLERDKKDKEIVFDPDGGPRDNKGALE